MNPDLQMLLTTDSPLDMICYKTSGSVTVPDGTLGGTHVIAHGLSFVPMPFLIWSNTSDFVISNVGGDSGYYANGPGQYYTSVADSTNITISLNNSSGSSKVLYYRIFCFIPSTVSDDVLVPHNADQSDNFLLSTDYNYMKLDTTNRVTTIQTTFDHNLGYIPTVVCWGVQYSGAIIDTIDQGTFSSIIDGVGGSTYPYLTTTQLIWESPSTYDALEFRLYIDGNE